MATNKLTQTAYADHLRAAADLAIEIAHRVNLHGDDARQACFATVLINAERHNLFMEPLPRDTKTPVIEQPQLNQTGDYEGVVTEQTSGKPIGGYEALVSPENQGAIKRPTPEEAEAGARKALQEGVKRACLLLNQEDWLPTLTNAQKDDKPSTLDAYIKKETDIGKSYSECDNDDLETLIRNLSHNLDECRAKKKSSEAKAGF